MKHFHLILVVLFVHVLVCASAPSPINWKTLPNMYFWANGWVKDGVTNRFFVTDDGDLYKKDLPPDYYVELPPKKVEATKQSKECRFAEDFPEGNWGTNACGFQLSLRFKKMAFAAGEPIEATLILRNVGDGEPAYQTLPVGYSDGPIGFEVTSAEGKALPQHTYNIDVINGGVAANLFAGTQVKFFERLDKRFDLTNSTYSVQAVAKNSPMPAILGISTNGYPIFANKVAPVQLIKSAPVTIKIRRFPWIY